MTHFKLSLSLSKLPHRDVRRCHWGGLLPRRWRAAETFLEVWKPGARQKLLGNPISMPKNIPFSIIFVIFLLPPRAVVSDLQPSLVLCLDQFSVYQPFGT